MIDLLLQNSLLLLFVVAALGYVIGRIKIRGISLGVSAVLFVGLFFGALHPISNRRDHLPLGLVLFVYTIGFEQRRGFSPFGARACAVMHWCWACPIFAAILAAVAHLLSLRRQ
jgi:putative transport protein